MAGRILQTRDIVGNPAKCDFCATLSFERALVFDRCRRYNAQAHVKTGHAYSGVRLINYILDNRKMVMEKQSKHFQFRFCPVCGYDYVQQKEFDGKLYKAPFSINKLPKSQVDNDA